MDEIKFTKTEQLTPIVYSTYAYKCLNCNQIKTSSYRLMQTGKNSKKFCGQKCRKEMIIKLAENNPKTCIRCKVKKTKKDFKRTGNDNRSQTYKRCMECELQIEELRKQEGVFEKASKMGTSYCTYHRSLSLENFLKDTVKHARARAKSLNREFDITYLDLLEVFHKQNGKCILSGIEMQRTVLIKKNPYNISIDRIDSKKGYTKDNIQLVCFIVNTMKLNYSDLEFFNNCKAVYNNLKEKFDGRNKE